MEDVEQGGAAPEVAPVPAPASMSKVAPTPARTATAVEPVSPISSAPAPTATLVVMRHGSSAWTDAAVNRFAGWVDVPLSDTGRAQAAHAGELLRAAGIAPDACFTSLLRRSIVTADIVLDAVDRLWVPVQRSWRLNERHYGAFQGQTRPAMRAAYGEERFAAYRRAYGVRPPEIEVDSPYYQGSDARYRQPDGLGGPDPAAIRCESLADLSARLDPFWRTSVEPLLAVGQCVLVVTHGSVVRAIRMRLEGISPEHIREVNIPTGVPLAYTFTTEGERPQVVGTGRYLDEAAARAGIADVTRLGRA